MNTMREIVTKDGSLTFYNESYDEAYHSISGALEEAQKKYIEPCQIQDGMAILDIGFGLGYNVAMAVHSAKHLTIVSLEKDPSVFSLIQSIAVPLWFRPSYALVQKAAAKRSYNDRDYGIRVIEGNAEESIKAVDVRFDAVFLDPFSPKNNPELWAEAFLRDVFARMKPCARLATYSCAGMLRRNLRSAGFEVVDGPIVGRRAPGTVGI